MNVRYQSSRLSRLQIASPPSAVPDAMRGEQPLDAGGIDDAALARAAIEQDVARDAVPRAAHPDAERHREAHLLAR